MSLMQMLFVRSQDGEAFGLACNRGGSCKLDYNNGSSKPLSHFIRNSDWFVPFFHKHTKDKPVLEWPYAFHIFVIFLFSFD